MSRRAPPLPLGRHDPRQARFLTGGSLRWIVRNRAWTPYHLRRYVRFALLKLRHPDVVTEGLVFLGKGVRLEARPGYGRIVLGRFVHIGDGNTLRAHEGTLRLGDKVVMGRDNQVNAHLDIEIGAGTIVSDWVYVCDFDHVTSDLTTPIKDQGIVKSPVRIGPGSWIGTKVSVLRGTVVGRGSVLAAHAVVRGRFPDYSIVGGVPARLLRRRDDNEPAVGSTVDTAVGSTVDTAVGSAAGSALGRARLVADGRAHEVATVQEAVRLATVPSGRREQVER
jgi:acetyltransferase-like isoleucine patch superfamily enzyme